MGSLAAMSAGSKDRYFQTNAKNLFPEGVEGRVPYRGSLADVIFPTYGRTSFWYGILRYA